MYVYRVDIDPFVSSNVTPVRGDTKWNYEYPDAARQQTQGRKAEIGWRGKKDG